MTVAAIAVSVAAVAAAGISAYSASEAADAQQEGLDNASATLGGGIARTEAFRRALDTWGSKYRSWQDQVTEPMVKSLQGPYNESQSYKDARGMLERSMTATGSVRSGAAIQGFRELASAEADNHFNRQMRLSDLLGTTNARNAAVQGSLLDSENRLIGGQADIEAQKGAVEAAKIQAYGDAAAGAISSIGGAIGGAYGGGGGYGSLMSMMGGMGGGGYAQTGGGGLYSPQVQSGMTGAGGIGGGSWYPVY